MALGLVSAAEAPLAWLLAALLLVSAALVLRRRSGPPWRLRLSADGGLELAQGEEPGVTARAIFVSRYLIVLACGSRSVACWPDALSPDHYRQVSAHVRWPSQSRASVGGDGDAA